MTRRDTRKARSPSTKAARSAKEEGRGTLALDELLPYLVNRLGNLTVQLFSRDLAPAGLTVPMWRVIAVLNEKGPSKLTDLALLTSIDQSTLSRLTVQMQTAGLIHRVRSQTSGRELVLDVSARGRKLVRDLAPVAQAYAACMGVGISERDLEVTRRVLRHMYDQLDALRLQADQEVRRSHRRQPVLARRGLVLSD
jgi:DNA-binding MarR family transcriptional regulator